MTEFDHEGWIPSCFSYYDLIFLSYRIQVPKVRAAFLFVALLGTIQLIDDNIAIDRLQSLDIDVKVFYFNSIIIFYASRVTFKGIKIKHKPSP